MVLVPGGYGLGFAFAYTMGGLGVDTWLRVLVLRFVVWLCFSGVWCCLQPGITLAFLGLGASWCVVLLAGVG